jgi:hypothetical protein
MKWVAHHHQNAWYAEINIARRIDPASSYFGRINEAVSASAYVSQRK